MINHPRKYFWLGLVLVFLLGIFGGAYLVLRTTVSYGEEEASTPLSAGKSSDELLAELLTLNEQEKESQNAYVAPEDKNLTDDFLSTMVSATGISEAAVRKAESSDFMVETVLPYFKSNEINLLPIIPTSVFKTVSDSKLNYKKYFTDTEKDATNIYGAINKILDVDLENISETKVINNLTTYSETLSISFGKLSEVSVPKKYTELHKNILLSAISAKKIAEAMINREEDPLKTLIVLNQFDEVVLFWTKTFGDYQKYFLLK
ncbi:MAG: hypothetical protein Q8Q95_03790 [bacterium]|nr:hypothetical protein [bacterium]